jgi:acyl-coenzyme A thioesterase PaaI-like protein
MNHKIRRSQFISKNCLVCGTENKSGLRAKFYETDTNEVIAVFRPREIWQGYPDILHGGISAALLDEVIARVIMAHHGEYTLGLTVELKLRYKKIVPLDTELRAIGRMVKDTRVVFEGRADLLLPDGSVAVSAEGKYFKRALDSLVDDNFLSNHWKAPMEHAPVEISLMEEI